MDAPPHSPLSRILRTEVTLVVLWLFLLEHVRTRYQPTDDDDVTLITSKSCSALLGAASAVFPSR